MGGGGELTSGVRCLKHHKNDDVDDIGDHFLSFCSVPSGRGRGRRLGKRVTICTPVKWIKKGPLKSLGLVDFRKGKTDHGLGAR